MGRKKEKSDPIGGFRYEVRQLPATEGLEIMTDLSQQILPSLGEIFKKVSGIPGGLKGLSFETLVSTHEGGDVLAAAAKYMVANLSGEKVLKIVRAMVGCTEIYGPGFGDAGAPMSSHFDEHFAGRYGELVRWLAFALQVNYGNFLNGLELGGSGGPDRDPEPAQK
jgi:hypothetical protein